MRVDRLRHAGAGIRHGWRDRWSSGEGAEESPILRGKLGARPSRPIAENSGRAQEAQVVVVAEIEITSESCLVTFLVPESYTVF